MIAIDKPYISDFLLKSIKEYRFPVIFTQEARSMINDQSLNWITEAEAKDRLRQNPHQNIYTNSENTIGWMAINAASTNLPGQIQVFKNKIKFRELLADTFPNYYFQGVGFKDLGKLDVKNIKFPVIIKPAVGFFSIAVHRVGNPSEWVQVLDTIQSEVELAKDLYPKEVINISDFIIEEYIEGEEYAVDCYFNQRGKPVVLNILHHLFSSGKDVSDRVYSTSKEIVEQNIEGILDFLEIIGRKANLVNFPAHVEIRVDKSGRINPIEVNPLRFGGWCTTGDLSWYAYGFNAYEYFFNGKSPDWKKILETRNEKTYSVIVLDNNSGIKESEIACFDYDQLLKDFEKPMDLRKTDYNKYAVFGFLFTETSEGNRKELNQILTSDLKKYIKLINVR